MTNTTSPIKPADLDSTRLHSPAELREWKAKTADYHQAIRDIERAKFVASQAAVAQQNRTLNEEEYFAMAVKRKAENDARIAEREAAEKAAALADIERLLSSPPTVDVLHRSEYSFMVEVIQWANRGYTMQDNGLMAMMPGLYHVILNAPAPAKKGASK